MKFRTALTLFFGLFLVMSSASSLLFVFRLFDRYASIIEDPEIPRSLESALDAVRDPELPDREKLARVTDKILDVRREYGRFSVEKKGLMIEVLTTFLTFLFGQVALLFALSYLAARLLTRPLQSIAAGLMRIEAGESAFRLPPLPGRELGLVGSRFNSMLDVIGEKEALLAEQSRLLGWQEVASFLAHQIKNPLAAVCLAAKNLDLAVAEDAREGIVEESLGILSRESRRVDELLTRFRRAVTFPELKPECTDIAALVESTAALLPADRAAFSLDLQRQVECAIDRGLIREALTNLFVNSIEAAGGKTSIAVSLRREGGACVIRVDDDVKDVPEETARRVLVTAFTTKSEGNGLGLLFVRKVAALHGGSIMARRAEDGGLVFELRLKGERCGKDPYNR